MPLPIYENPILYLLSGGTGNPAEQYLNYNVSAHTNPSYVSAVENPIVYTLKSSAYTSTSTYAVASMTIFDLYHLPTVGEYFILSGDSVSDFPSYQFTASDEPKVNEFYTSGTTPTKTVLEIASSIVYAMNENVSFRQRFYAVIRQSVTNLSEIVICAREAGSRYNMNIYDPFGLFYSIVYDDATDTNIGQNLKDYSLFADVYINSGGFLGGYNGRINRLLSNKVSSIEIGYNQDNIYNFDLSNIVKNYIHTPLPSINSGMTYTCENLINFYLVFGEKYDEFDNGYRRRFYVGQTEVDWALNSSLDKLSYNSLSAYTIDYTNIYSAITYTPTSYLKSSPTTISTFKDQKQFLSILFAQLDYIALTYEFQVRGVYTLNDGSITPYTGFTSTQASGGCLTANVSVSDIGIPLTNLQSYTTKIYSRCTFPTGLSFIESSPDQTYEVIQTCKYEHAQEIHWLNPLGGWDTWVFNGETESKAKRKSEEFSVATNSNPLPSDSLDKVLSLEVERQITINSGWVDKEHADWLFELAKSKDVRLFEDDIHKAIIVIDVEVQPSTEDDLHSVSLTYRLAKEENTLSNY